MSPSQPPHNLPHGHDDEHDDDKPVGRLLSRREMLSLIGGSGAALIFGAGFTRLNFAQQTGTATPAAAATAMPTCVVKPEMTEGPYFVDTLLNRRDIRRLTSDLSDTSVKPGIPMRLIFNVTSVSADACVPLEGAMVDIWHCDALGEYSGVSDTGFDTTDQTWLRGYQVTDANGVAEFITIYPGWYSGRAVHIHFKIRVDNDEASAYEFTSQLFFSPDMNEIVYANEPYNQKGQPDTPNTSDNIYQGGGDQLLLSFTPLTAAEFNDAIIAAEATAEAGAASSTPDASAANVEQDGYQAIFAIGLDLTDTSVGASDSAGGGGGGRGGRGGRP